jgi:hypothetical protein
VAHSCDFLQEKAMEGTKQKEGTKHQEKAVEGTKKEGKRRAPRKSS